MASAPYRDSEVTAQVHVEGDPIVYRTVYDKRDLVWVFGDYGTDGVYGGTFGTNGFPLPGFNQFAPTSYANLYYGTPAVADGYSVKFTQIIFSTQPIPVPTS
jgi:hypothetical protein